jgi:hypothetical protein
LIRFWSCIFHRSEPQTASFCSLWCGWKARESSLHR